MTAVLPFFKANSEDQNDATVPGRYAGSHTLLPHVTARVLNDWDERSRCVLQMIPCAAVDGQWTAPEPRSGRVC